MKVVLLASALVALYFLLRARNKKNPVETVVEPETVEEFAYLTESEFKPDTVYIFESPFGWNFESMVTQDLDKNGKPVGSFYTLASNQQSYKAGSIRCKLKK